MFVPCDFSVLEKSSFLSGQSVFLVPRVSSGVTAQHAFWIATIHGVQFHVPMWFCQTLVVGIKTMLFGNFYLPHNCVVIPKPAFAVFESR